ncbi:MULTISPECIES: lipopolysaccharide biosynthesis protein [Haloferax]|uniref:Oligosaccharide flippase family protein n=1 Tax=Haloferax marinum TaxID=2666143 RepID=A0A6A8G3C6_9EURY|nr:MULTISPECIES: polysaccharide biosynthesis C-terminal domain-containing protein [Haloferax]KAB1196267.1 oligosaccharide flippase family protein [Haloferax sp. CBA1150]MRW95255.1 oligosaccharide flippase family protein [Haloferax marinum]
MKRGQTSIVHFAGQIVLSVSGFAVNLYVARTLGSEVLGQYALVVSVIAWLTIGSDLGLHQSVKKRLSESDDRQGVLNAAGLAQFGLLFVIGSLVYLLRGRVDQYIGAPVGEFVVAMLAVNVIFQFLQFVLVGQHKVHISGLMPAVWWGGRAIFQIGLIVLGYALFGLIWGYIISGLIGIVVSLYFISYRPTIPSRDDFRQLTSFAKYSWIGPLKGRSWLSMDTIILGFFISKSLIGVYEIAWNIAALFAIFGVSISTAHFPEISSLAADEETEKVREAISNSLAYAGLFLIPGFVGSALVGEQILSIYGGEFAIGAQILLILVFAQLIYSYEQQFSNALDAMDHPESTFRINIIFIGLNLVLNILLVYLYGWYGAAVATTISAGVSVLYSYTEVSRYVTVKIPYREIGKQVVAAGLMGALVVAGKSLFGASLGVVIVLVGVGAGAYFGTLFGISRQFRKTVRDNLPATFT